VRKWYHLLAATEGLDGGRRMAGGAPAVAGYVEPARSDRLVPRGDRQQLGTCCFWGNHTGPNPTDRAKNGCKRHLVTDAGGIPLAVQITPANVHDSKLAIAMLDLIPAVRGKVGHPRYRPETYLGDAAYWSRAIIAGTRQRGVTPRFRKIGSEHGSGLGRFRYVVERTLAWFGNRRRLRLCYEKTGDIFQGLHDLTAALICANKLAILENGL